MEVAYETNVTGNVTKRSNELQIYVKTNVRRQKWKLTATTKTEQELHA